MTTFNYDHIVVRYGELSTKGKNRKDFTKALTNNIKKRQVINMKIEKICEYLNDIVRILMIYMIRE